MVIVRSEIVTGAQAVTLKVSPESAVSKIFFLYLPVHSLSNTKSSEHQLPKRPVSWFSSPTNAITQYSQSPNNPWSPSHSLSNKFHCSSYHSYVGHNLVDDGRQGTRRRRLRVGFQVRLPSFWAHGQLGVDGNLTEEWDVRQIRQRLATALREYVGTLLKMTRTQKMMTLVRQIWTHYFFSFNRNFTLLPWKSFRLSR